jgi:hypothetical protein
VIICRDRFVLGANSNEACYLNLLSIHTLEYLNCTVKSNEHLVAFLSALNCSLPLSQRKYFIPSFSNKIKKNFYLFFFFILMLWFSQTLVQQLFDVLMLSLNDKQLLEQ